MTSDQSAEGLLRGTFVDFHPQREGIAGPKIRIWGHQYFERSAMTAAFIMFDAYENFCLWRLFRQMIEFMRKLTLDFNTQRSSVTTFSLPGWNGNGGRKRKKLKRLHISSESIADVELVGGGCADASAASAYANVLDARQVVIGKHAVINREFLPDVSLSQEQLLQ